MLTVFVKGREVRKDFEKGSFVLDPLKDITFLTFQKDLIKLRRELLKEVGSRRFDAHVYEVYLILHNDTADLIDKVKQIDFEVKKAYCYFYQNRIYLKYEDLQAYFLMNSGVQEV